LITVHNSKIDAAGYFISKINELAQPTYVPSYDDILRIRIRTTGIFETEFAVDAVKFRMFDVGGQRNERRKWIHSFEGVTAVIFVAAISEFDQVCFEDEKTNRMEDSLTLFSEICNSRWFSHTSILLFLNKKDLFAEKITKVPLTVCFPDYVGSNTFDDALNYIKRQFLSKNQADKSIYIHVTCATDKDNVRMVFNTVKDIIIRSSMKDTGIL